ncbi:MAG: helix-turn-helix domain-containing protein [Planctomycetes bacterium]|nr:helix-turn-helix domain-containing protein [Planctomycetota bacterium]
MTYVLNLPLADIDELTEELDGPFMQIEGACSSSFRDGKGLIHVGRAAARKQTRARILLKVNQGESGPGWGDGFTAQSLEVGVCTIANVRQRFVEGGVESALERRKQVRPSKLRKLDGAREARLVAIGCSKAPEGRARWTMRMLADP